MTQLAFIFKFNVFHFRFDESLSLLFFTGSQYSKYKRYDFQMSNVWLLFGVVFGIRISELPGWVQIPPLVEKARAPYIKKHKN